MSPIYLCSLVTASTVNNLVATDDDDPIETAKDTIASRVTQESKQLNGMPGCSEPILYNYSPECFGCCTWTKQFNFEIFAIENISQAAPNMSRSFDGNMITNVITNRPSSLQTAVRFSLSKCSTFVLLNYSYDEAQRFEPSTAKTAVDQSNRRRIEHGGLCLSFPKYVW